MSATEPFHASTIRAVCIAGRAGWDGVTEVVMAHSPVVERKAERFLANLLKQGYTLNRASGRLHHEGPWEMHGSACECECAACWDQPNDMCLCPACTDADHNHPSAKGRYVTNTESDG